MLAETVCPDVGDGDSVVVVTNMTVAPYFEFCLMHTVCIFK